MRSYAHLIGASIIATVIPHSGDAKNVKCPIVLTQATQLFLAIAPKLSSSTGSGQLYSRQTTSDRWSPVGAKFALSFGRNGLGWSFDQTAYGQAGAPTKREGDKRTPAGIFRAGQPFSLRESNLKNYLRLSEGTVCVDDIRSKKYNQVTRLSDIKKNMSHEKMWRIELYSSGVIVDTPTNQKKRGGSCIFLHVWRSPGKPTAGCVASDEINIQRIQQLFSSAKSAVALLPKDALKAFEICGLPVEIPRSPEEKKL